MLGFLFFEILKIWFGIGDFNLFSPCRLRADLAGNVCQPSLLSFYLAALAVPFTRASIFFLPSEILCLRAGRVLLG